MTKKNTESDESTKQKLRVSAARKLINAVKSSKLDDQALRQYFKTLQDELNGGIVAV
jgi:hypothetical protein